MTLDNSYSYLKAKTVLYNFEILEHELTMGKDGDEFDEGND